MPPVPIYSAFRAHARTNVPLLVSGTTVRLYPMVVPQTPAYPLGVYQNIGGDTSNTLARGSASMLTDRYQFTLYAQSFDNGLIPLRDQFFAAFNVGRVLLGGVLTASATIPSRPIDDYEADTKLYKSIVVVEFRYKP
jgi:hypothetical protein